MTDPTGRQGAAESTDVPCRVAVRESSHCSAPAGASTREAKPGEHGQASRSGNSEEKVVLPVGMLGE